MRLETARAWIDVDLGALKRNAQQLAGRAGVSLLPMVKSDGYGLGVAAVTRTLESLHPWGYGVATVEEGAELRALGIARPILVFTPVLADALGAVREHRLTPTFGDADRVTRWRDSGGGPWHLAIDTGMNRAGCPWDRVASLGAAVAGCPPEGAFTHFHSADQHDGSLDQQQRRFAQAVAALPARPRYLHAENSPAIERQAPSPWDLARPGVSLYGVGGGAGALMKPEPVASLHARIVDLRAVGDGESVSYGATWRARGPRTIATVGAGYADGIRRSLSNRGCALVGGTRVPVAGVVTMDMTMLDVTGVACAVGDVATFLGRQGETELTIDEVAAAGDLSPYELLVGFRLRAQRRYREAQ